MNRYDNSVATTSPYISLVAPMPLQALTDLARDHSNRHRNALDEIMDIDNPSEMVYKEILDHIDVHKNKVLDIWLKSVPFGIRLKIETEGRSTTYKTKILETELIEKSKGVMSKTI